MMMPNQRRVGTDEKDNDDRQSLLAQHAVPVKAAMHVQAEHHQQPERRLQRGADERCMAENLQVQHGHVLHDLPSAVNVPQTSGHEQVTDQGQSDHRLLVSSQEPQKPSDKFVHKSKLWAQSCQGKSHQRLMLMTALHKTAHKQLKRQHKHAGQDQISP